MRRLQSEARFPVELTSTKVKVFGRWADDPAELPPFGLNFTEELLPPKKGRLFNASINKGRLVLTCSGKR